MIIDQFTKWLDCYPLPDQEADTVATSFIEGFISRLGCPLQIHSDQGRNFERRFISGRLQITPDNQDKNYTLQALLKWTCVEIQPSCSSGYQMLYGEHLTAERLGLAPPIDSWGNPFNRESSNRLHTEQNDAMQRSYPTRRHYVRQEHNGAKTSRICNKAGGDIVGLSSSCKGQSIGSSSASRKDIRHQIKHMQL